MSCLWPWRLSLLTKVLNDWLSCMWITCCCWPHCCRFLETVSWGRWVEGSRSQLWPIASGKDLHLSSAGRSAEDCQLLQKETGVKQLVRLVEDRSERELTPPIGSGLTDAVFGKRDVPLRWSALLLSFRAAAVSQLWRFGEKGRPPVLQLSVYCEKHAKTTKVILWKVPLSCLSGSDSKNRLIFIQHVTWRHAKFYLYNMTELWHCLFVLFLLPRNFEDRHMKSMFV